MNIRTLSKCVIGLVMMLAVTACRAPASTPAGPTEVQVRLTDFKIELDKSTIPAGKVKFVILNVSSTTQHELVIENVGDVDKAMKMGDKTAEASDINPGKSATMEWTLDKPGKYLLACHKNLNKVDHFASGMKTEITVQ